MVKSRIFDNIQLLKEHPEIPHYGEEVVCFKSGYKDRSYPADEQYFNRELYMILILEGRSEIQLNGEQIVMERNTLLIHGANYLTSHLSSSPDIEFITLSISESMQTNDSYFTQIVSILLATMRQNKQYTLRLTDDEACVIHKELEELMRLLDSQHSFLFRRVQASCNALFLDIGDFLSRKTIIKKHISPKDHVLQEFHALVTRHFKEEHFVGFYADKLAISEQYLSRIVRGATGRSVNTIINELLTMEAQTLLGSRKLAVSEIAVRLCFSDASAFCKFFKRNTGETPLEFQKALWRR
ncbi:AraC family transcriptional regulator [Bacteroides sp.]|uniref:AraC family transcriptional regulator n=1 Tax=Bacteroides sp. TaxID=29523 RepID=UPI002618D9EC|nr:AraC family transcriptional regulator [Bacteroides sp.]